MTDWYYADAAHNRQGPVPTEALQRLRETGAINDGTLVWRDGLDGWQPLRALAHELPGDVATDAPIDPWAPAQPDATPVEPAPADAWQPAAGAGDTRDASDPWQAHATPQPASPYAAPAAAVDRPDTVVHGGEVVYAGFRKRLAAYVIDSLIVGVAFMVISTVVGVVLGGLMAVSGSSGNLGFVLLQVLIQLFSIAITALYYAWFHASRSMATPGKMAVGIKVVRVQGERISFLRGIGRYFASLLSGLILCIGFLMAAFTARKQGLHDLMCDTLVVDRWAFTEYPQLQRRELGTAALIVLILLGILVGLGVLVLVALGIASLGR